jgi:GWxTD domain-containing protein
MRARLTVFAASLLLLAVWAVPVFSRQEIGATRGDVGVAEDLLEWDRSPAGFLLTKKEKKAWKNITTEAQAEKFIELFWAKRNPDPRQSFNSFKAQFESRVRYADENFAYRGGRGALSDRGRILILMGPPHQAEHRMATETVESMDNTVLGSDEVRGNAELWMFDPARLPDEFKVRGSRLLYVFYEERVETNEYTLDRSHPEATMGMRVLTNAPELYLLHPDLQEVPRPVSVPGARSAAAAHLAWVGQGSAPWTEQARLLVEAGVADPDHRPLWYHLELPSDAPELDLLVGRVRSSEGKVLSTFELDAEPLSRGDNTAYHIGFPLIDGSYGLDVVGAAGGQPQVSYSADVTVPQAPVEGSWMSPMWIGVESEVKEDAMLGSPFCFGRFHLIPLLPNSAVKREKEMMFLGFAIRPGLDEEGVPKFTARIALKKNGKRLGRPLDMPVEGSIEVTDDLWVYMNAINLAALPETGLYGLAFSVTDKISDVTVEREIEINVVE